MASSLTQYQVARRALAEASRVDEVKDILDKAAAMKEYARRAKDHELIGYATEIRVRAEIKAGELLSTMDRKKPGDNQHGKTGSNKVLPPPKLSDLGVSKMQSSRWQRLAALSKEQQEEKITMAKRKAESAIAPPPKVVSKTKASKAPKRRETPRLDEARAIVRAAMDAGEPVSARKLEAKTGISHAHFDSAIAAERAVTEVQSAPPIDAATLPMSAQEKLAAALRQQQRQQERDFETRVLAECRKRLDEMILPHHAKKLADAQAIIAARKGVMPRASFKKILACLHPDRVSDELKPKYTEAFHILSELEVVLCKESELPTQAVDFPRTYAEMMERKQQVSEKRKAKRGSNDVGRAA